MTSKAVLERFFEEPGGHIVMDLRMHIIESGPEFRRLTGTTESNITGKSVLEVLTDPDPTRRKEVAELLTNSFQNAVRTKLTDKMPVFRCDISLVDGTIEERWWQSANIPVLNEKEEVEFIVHRAEDVTLMMKTARHIKGIRGSNYILYFLVMLTIGIMAVAFSKVTSQNAQNSHQAKIVASEAKTAASEARKLAQQFQSERLNNIRINCETQNAKHQKTITALDKLTKQSIKQRRQPSRSATSIHRQNEFLVNTFEPHQDCTALVKRAQQSKP